MANRYNDYNRGAYQDSYYHRPKQYQRQNHAPRKRSGCATGTSPKNDKPFIRGWKTTRNGLIKFIGCPGEQSRQTTSKAGIDWCTISCKFTNTRTGETWYQWGMWNMNNKKLYFKDSNQIANPSAPNGGYYGKHISKSYQ